MLKKYMSHIIVGVAMLVGGVLIGTSGSTTEVVTETVTTTATATTTVTKQETPDDCLKAIEEATELLEYSAEFMDVFVEHIGHDQEFVPKLAGGDYTGFDSYILGLEDTTGKILDITSAVEANEVVKYALGCKAQA